jgi:hypothetical protein
LASTDSPPTRIGATDELFGAGPADEPRFVAAPPQAAMRSETTAIDPAAVAILVQDAADRRQNMAIMGSPLSRALAAA